MGEPHLLIEPKYTFQSAQSPDIFCVSDANLDRLPTDKSRGL
jgi:hypothetical protein